MLRGALCFFLAVTIAFIPLDFRIATDFSPDSPVLEVQRNEAQAFAPVVAGGGAAVAAALGITEAELATGLAITFAAGAGLYLYYSSNNDLTTWPTDQSWPGFKPWDDLTPQEKQNWVGQDGDVGDYWQQQIDLYSLNYGLWDYNSQGNPEPTPEPEDPDEKEKWFTKNNVVTALGTGAAVGVGTIAQTLVNDAANGLADLLFGSDVATNKGLGIDYVNTINTSSRSYQFGYWTGGTRTYNQWVYNVSGSDWVFAERESNYIAYYDLALTTGSTTNSVSMSSYTVEFTARTNSNEYSSFNFPSASNAFASYFNVYNDGTVGGGSGGRPSSFWYAKSRLNASFAGTYVFKDTSGTETARYANGAASGNYTNSVNYGQMQDTPAAITNNVLNSPSYVTNVNNYQNVDSGNQKAAQIPTSFTGPNNTPTYADFVKTTPNEDITPIPDDEPIPTPGPGPTPDEPTQYQEDFGDEVSRLLSQPFDQLFPFCLIGDLRVFTEKINTAFTGTGNRRAEPNYEQLVIPLEEFNVDGLENITFNLTPLRGIAAIIKPWINALLVVALLIGSFRFFLNRGGE